MTIQGDVTQGRLLAAAAHGCCQDREMEQLQEKLWKGIAPWGPKVPSHSLTQLNIDYRIYN